MEKRVKIRAGKKILWESTIVKTPEYPRFSAGETAHIQNKEYGTFDVTYNELFKCNGDTYFLKK